MQRFSAYLRSIPVFFNNLLCIFIAKLNIPGCYAFGSVLLNGYERVLAVCHRFSWVFKKIRKHIRNCTYRLLVVSLPCLKRALFDKPQILVFLCVLTG